MLTGPESMRAPSKSCDIRLGLKLWGLLSAIPQLLMIHWSTPEHENLLGRNSAMGCGSRGRPAQTEAVRETAGG